MYNEVVIYTREKGIILSALIVTTPQSYILKPKPGNLLFHLQNTQIYLFHFQLFITENFKYPYS